jgi:hypothetical protein
MMYSRDVPLIKQYVLGKGEEGLLDVISFVLATIQTPLSRTGGMVKDIKLRGASSPHLWGSKVLAYTYCRDNLMSLYEALVNTECELPKGIDMLLEAPGLGLPKASFILQCIGYDTACLDSHNLKRYNLPISITKIGKVKRQTKLLKINSYISVVQKEGTEYHWNSWCKYVSGNRWNKRLPTGDTVSAYHYEAITGL